MKEADMNTVSYFPKEDKWYVAKDVAVASLIIGYLMFVSWLVLV